jgi:hypothetical protein
VNSLAEEKENNNWLIAADLTLIGLIWWLWPLSKKKR